MKHKSKATKFLEYIERNPGMKYTEIQLFFYRQSKKNNSIKAAPRGYYSTSIQKLIYKKHIKKDQNNLYKLTRSGKKNQQNPYAETVQEKTKHAEYIKRCEYIEEHYKDLERHDKWTLNGVIERGHVENVRELIALLKTLPEYLPVELAIDAEINATGKIASSICVDNIDKPREAILFPIETKPVE